MRLLFSPPVAAFGAGGYLLVVLYFLFGTLVSRAAQHDCCCRWHVQSARARARARPWPSGDQDQARAEAEGRHSRGPVRQEGPGEALTPAMPGAWLEQQGCSTGHTTKREPSAVRISPT